MKIATRRSPLALYQANLVKELIESNSKDIHCILVPMTSEGDEVKGPLEEHGGKGLFIGSLENALKTAELPLPLPPEVARLRRARDLSAKQLANKRVIGAQDLAWALINTPSFLFNR